MQAAAPRSSCRLSKLRIIAVARLGLKALWAVVQAVSLYSLVWGVVGFMSAIEGIPRSVILINWVLAILAIGGLRMAARWMLSDVNGFKKSSKNNVIIYGAGSAGRQLLTANKHY